MDKSKQPKQIKPVKRSEQIEVNRQWYINRDIDVDLLIKKEQELESSPPIKRKGKK